MCVCVVPPAGRKLVSIMSSDRRDGNIRDERNIELDEKRGVVVSYGSSRRSRSVDGGASNSPCFLDIKYNNTIDGVEGGYDDIFFRFVSASYWARQNGQ